MKKLILLLTILATNLLAVDNSIYTWGYGEIFYKVLQGVTILSTESYLFKSALAVGGLLLMIREGTNNVSSGDMGMGMIKYLILVTLIMGLFVETKKTYVVEDEVTGQTFPVNNVPIGIGETFSMFTMLEKALAKGFETAFATPHSIAYSNAGLGFTMSAPLNLLKVDVRDAYTIRNFNEYMDNCFISATAAGELNPNILLQSKNLKSDLKVTGYLTPWYSNANPDGVDTQCQDAWDNLNNKIDSELDLIAGKAAAYNYLDKQKFEDGLAASTKLIYGASQSSKDYLMQQTMIKMANKGLQSALLATGGDAAAIASATALAENTQQKTWQMGGILAQQNLPLMKAVFTVLVLGIFMLLVVLSLVYGNIGHIKMGFTLLLAMALWTPLAILINGTMNIAIEKVLPVVASGGLAGENFNEVSSQLQSYLSFMGFLASSIPIFAYSIAKMSEHGFVSFFNSAGNSGGAGAGAGQLASGNISQGNTSLNKFVANDQIGSHDYHGANNWGHKTSGDTGAIRSEFSNGAGAGTLETNNAGKVGNMVINSQTGEISKVEGSTVSYGASKEIIKGRDEAKATAQTDGTNFSTAMGNTISSSILENGSVIDTTSTSHNFGFQKSENEALTKSRDESLVNSFNDLIKSGQTVDFKSTNGVDGKFSASVGTPGIADFAGGVKVGANGAITLSGTTSDGKDFTSTLSGGQAEMFKQSFTKNITKQISDNESLNKALSSQVVENKGFGDSDLATKADTYNKSFSKADTLTNTIHEGANDRNSFSQDLNPKILNKMIDNDEELRTLRDKGGKEGKYKAAEIADDRLNNNLFKDDVLKAYQDVTGVKLDTKTANISTDLAQAKTDFQTLQTNNDNNSGAVIANATSRVAHVPSSVADVPHNVTDLANERKDLTTQYDKDKAKLEKTADKELDTFENKESLHSKASIDKKLGAVQSDIDKANLNVGVTSAMKQNPAIAGLIKTGGEVGELIQGAGEKFSSTYGADGNIYNGDKKTGDWNNKRVDVKKQIETNEDRNEKAYEKATSSGLVEKGVVTDSINPAMMKKADTDTLKRVYQESKDKELKDFGFGMDDKSDNFLKKELESRGVHFTQSGNNVFDKNITTDKNVIGLVEQSEQSAHKSKSKPAGGMGGDTLDGGSGTDTFQPPLPEVTTKIQEQPKQQVTEQVSRPQIVSEQPIQSKNDFSKSMFDKGVFEDKSGSNVNWDKFSKLQQKEVDTYMNHFGKDANAPENQNDFNRNSQPTISNNQNSGTQNFESQLEPRREPERVQTTQPREERVEPTKQPQEITRPQAVDEHISKPNLETEEGQRLKKQNEESTQSIKKLFKELEELKESQ